MRDAAVREQRDTVAADCQSASTRTDRLIQTGSQAYPLCRHDRDVQAGRHTIV